MDAWMPWNTQQPREELLKTTDVLSKLSPICNVSHLKLFLLSRSFAAPRTHALAMPKPPAQRPAKQHAIPPSVKQVEREFHNNLDFSERAQASDYLSQMHEKVDLELEAASKRGLLKVSCLERD